MKNKTQYKLLYLLSHGFNILFGIYTLTSAVIFLGMYLFTFKNFLAPANNTIGDIFGSAFISSGFLYLAIIAIAVGSIYIYFTYKYWKQQSNVTISLTLIALTVLLFSFIRTRAIDQKETLRQQTQAMADNQKIISASAITSDIDSFQLTHHLTVGTAGTYLVQIEFTTEGSDPQLYFHTYETTLESDQTEFKQQIKINDIFSTCNPSSKNWICVGLTKEDVSLQNIPLIFKSKITYIQSKKIPDYLTKQTYILDPNIQQSIFLTPNSTLTNIEMLK